MERLKPGWAVHPPCGQSWSGEKTSHCSACCISFTCPSAFDKHRVGRADNRRCVPPEEAGLVLTAREYECYGLPLETERNYPDVG